MGEPESAFEKKRGKISTIFLLFPQSVHVRYFCAKCILCAVVMQGMRGIVILGSDGTNNRELSERKF